TWILATGFRARHSPGGIVWTALTAAVMLALAAGKARVGAALDNPVLRTEGRVTLVDALLAAAVLLGLLLNAALAWWWADPAAAYLLVFYAVGEARALRRSNAPAGLGRRWPARARACRGLPGAARRRG